MPIPILILGSGLAITGSMALWRAQKEGNLKKQAKVIKGRRVKVVKHSPLLVTHELQARQQYKQQTNHNLTVSGVTIGIGACAKLLYPPLLWISVPLTLYSSIPIFSDTFKGLFNKRRINSSIIDSIAVMGTLVSHYYFASTLMSGLYFLGKKLQLETESDFCKLSQQQPDKVWLWQQDVEIEVPYDTVKAGDIVLVKAGELIPFDGKIVAGVATIDLHLLTGQAQPLEKSTDDKVLAMTLLTTGQLQIQVEKMGQKTLAAQINNALVSTPDYKDSVEARSVNIADKLTWPTLALSGAVFGIMGSVGAITVINSNFSNAVQVFTPLGMLNYQKLAYQQGILIKDGRSLELLNQVDTVIFDKSILLTIEHLEVRHIHSWQDIDALELLRLSAAARHNLSKPVGEAIQQAASIAGLSLAETENHMSKSDYGFKGMIEGRAVHIGNSHFMTMNAISRLEAAEQTEQQAHRHGHSLIYVAIDNSISGAIELQVNLRPEAWDTIQALRKRGLAIRIITSDDEKPTQTIAQALGVKSFIANMSSDDKANYIEQRQLAGESICFIGDGLNDTIAMKKAQVSMALSGASAAVTNTANIVMMEDNLDKLAGLFDFADDFYIDMKTNMALALTPGALGIASLIFFRLSIYSVMSLYAMTLALGAVNTVLPLLRTRKILIMENHYHQQGKGHLSEQADKLIKKYAYSSSLTGFIPIPMLDIVGLMSVQRIMLYRMSVLYDVPFQKHLAKALLTTLMGSLASGVAAPVAGSALKLIPGVGTLIGGAGMATLGGASTYAIGRVFKQHFEEGGTLEDFDPNTIEGELEIELEKGKELAKKETNTDDCSTK